MIARENISQTKTSNHTSKLQTLNGENSTIKTGNIPSDNENLFVNSTRRVADVTDFYSNRKTTGAEGTPKSHLAEVDCIMQADPNEPGAQQKADIGFPTPPPTPKKLLPNGKTAFPLFESLLKEGVNEQLNEHQLHQRAPATAPILNNNTVHCQPTHSQPTEVRVHRPEKSNTSKSTPGLVVNLRFDGTMDQKDIDEKKEQIAKAVEEAMKVAGVQKQDEENIQPITLQDPPKPKLKRQLSVGTFEKTERDRSPKRAYTQNKVLSKGVGSEQMWTPYVDPKPDEVDGAPTATKQDMPKTLDRGTQETYHQFASSQRTQGFGEPLVSPHYFSMKEIELTSPFLTSTTRRSLERDENVFVFPEAADQRTSPVKQSPSRSRSATGVQPSLPVTSTRQPGSSELSQSSAVMTPILTQQRAHVTDAVKDTPVPSHFTNQRLPEYVSSDGFKWPRTANITEPIPFSPRIVTATVNQNSVPPVPADAPGYRTNEEIEKLEERIKLLEREYERAKEIYHPKPANNCQFSPGSREIQDILRRSALRSISDIERSPNEKEIRRIEEEVKSRYERSISDPTYSPRHRQRFVPQPSPLGKQNIGDENDYKDAQVSFHSQGTDRWRDSWQEEVRRQLFAREEVHPVYDPLPTPTPESVFLEDMQLPDEVARFFHSKSFHPEDLENLKGILKRSHDQHVQSPRTSHEKLHQLERRPVSALPVETLQSRVLSSGDCRNVETQRNLLASFDNVRQFIGSPLLSKSHGTDKRPTGIHVNRDRKIGDIDVRISCESISEKVRQAKEILKDLEHNTGNCQCQIIEQEILAMTNEAFARIRRMDRTNESFIKFSEELNEANTNVYRSLEILCGIKCMCKYGRTLDEIYSGSIVFRFNCPNLYALEDLWESYKSGDFERLVIKTFVTQELKDKYNADDIQLKVTVSWEEYKKCKSELEFAENGLLSCLSPTQSSFQTSSPLPVSHCRSRSEPIVNSVSASGQLLHKPTMSPFRERICSDSTVELSPRRAFQEINVGKDTSRLSVSPSKKSLLENVFADSDSRRSPNLSPRRKSFLFKSPREHENIEPDSRTGDSVKHRVSDV